MPTAETVLRKTSAHRRHWKGQIEFEPSTRLWNKMFSTESRGRMGESCRYAKTEIATLSKRSRAILMFRPQRAPHHPAINVFPNFCSYSAECPLAVLVASHQQRHSFFFVRCPGQSLLRLHIFASNATQLLYRASEKS